MSGSIIKQAKFGILAILAIVLSGCAGDQAFTSAARPGETILLPVGWKPELTRGNLTVTMTPESGTPITYAPGDSRVRSVMNAYPDPVSKLMVADRAKVVYPAAGLSHNGESYGDLGPDVTQVVGNLTGNDLDWSNTLVLLDLPVDLPPGDTSIVLSSGGTPVVDPLIIEILPVTAGTRNLFAMQGFAGIGAMIRSVERAPHFVVTPVSASGAVPHSIQVEFGRTVGDQGQPWVTNGRGDIMNVLWSDDGAVLRVMLTPANGTTVERLSDFKFYVTGSVTGLTSTQVKAYDAAGNALSGYSITTEFVNN